MREAWPPPRTFYERSAVDVAPELLGVVLRRGERAGRIVEVEAYQADDPASHAFGGPRRRNLVMFGPPGHLYVYFSYGVHWCANVVCGRDGVGTAVLLRALCPTEGLEEMRAARPAARRDRDLCSGPGKLTQALGISGVHDGVDIVTGAGGVAVVDDGWARPPASAVTQTTRIGITKAVDRPWRWYLTANPHVSRRVTPPRGGQTVSC